MTLLAEIVYTAVYNNIRMKSLDTTKTYSIIHQATQLAL